MYSLYQCRAARIIPVPISDKRGALCAALMTTELLSSSSCLHGSRVNTGKETVSRDSALLVYQRLVPSHPTRFQLSPLSPIVLRHHDPYDAAAYNPGHTGILIRRLGMHILLYRSRYRDGTGPVCHLRSQTQFTSKNLKGIQPDYQKLRAYGRGRGVVDEIAHWIKAREKDLITVALVAAHLS